MGLRGICRSVFDDILKTGKAISSVHIFLSRTHQQQIFAENGKVLIFRISMVDVILNPILNITSFLIGKQCSDSLVIFFDIVHPHLSGNNTLLQYFQELPKMDLLFVSEMVCFFCREVVGTLQRFKSCVIIYFISNFMPRGFRSCLSYIKRDLVNHRPIIWSVFDQ